MKIWMMVTKDKYELPVLVADSAAELAKMAGAKKQNVHTAVSNWKNGIKKYSRYICVEVEDEE